MIYVYSELRNPDVVWKTAKKGDWWKLTSHNNKVWFPINSKISNNTLDNISKKLGKVTNKTFELFQACHEKTLMSFNFQKGYHYLGHVGDNTKFNTDVFLLTIDVNGYELLNVKLFGAYVYKYAINEKVLTLACTINKNGSKGDKGKLPSLILNFKDHTDESYVQKVLSIDDKNNYTFNTTFYKNVDEIPKQKNGKPVMDIAKHPDVLDPNGTKLRLPVYRPKKPSYFICVHEGDEKAARAVVTGKFRTERDFDRYIFHVGDFDYRADEDAAKSNHMYVTYFIKDFDGEKSRSVDFEQTFRDTNGADTVRHISIIDGNGMIYHIC